MSRNLSSEQTEMLLSFMDGHRELARGCLRHVEGRERARRLWEDITRRLNALGGSHKTVQQWQKAWTDKKYIAKKAAIALKTREQQTSSEGGPSSSPAPQPSERDLMIMDIMGEEFGLPMPVSKARVQAFPLPVVSSTADDEQEIVTIDDDEEADVVTTPSSPDPLPSCPGSPQSVGPPPEEPPRVELPLVGPSSVGPPPIITPHVEPPRTGPQPVGPSQMVLENLQKRSSKKRRASESPDTGITQEELLQRLVRVEERRLKLDEQKLTILRSLTQSVQELAAQRQTLFDSEF